MYVIGVDFGTESGRAARAGHELAMASGGHYPDPAGIAVVRPRAANQARHDHRYADDTTRDDTFGHGGTDVMKQLKRRRTPVGGGPHAA